MKKINKLGCLWYTIIISLIVYLLFIIVVGGGAAIDKSNEKLVEYKDCIYHKMANKLGIKIADDDTTICVIKDTIPKKLPFKIKDKNKDDDVIKIKLEIKDDMMFIRPKINGVEMRFLLDTGCSDIHLTPIEAMFLEHQGLFDSNKVVGTTTCIYADGKEHECVEYILKSIELGGIKIDSVNCTLDQESGTTNDYPLLGQKILKSFGNIMINYGDSTLIIKKNKK